MNMMKNVLFFGENLLLPTVLMFVGTKETSEVRSEWYPVGKDGEPIGGTALRADW